MGRMFGPGNKTKTSINDFFITPIPEKKRPTTFPPCPLCGSEVRDIGSPAFNLHCHRGRILWCEKCQVEINKNTQKIYKYSEDGRRIKYADLQSFWGSTK